MFELDGHEYTLEEVTKQAEQENISIDDFVNKYKMNKVEGKTNGVAVEDVAVTSSNPVASENMESNLEESLSDSAYDNDTIFKVKGYNYSLDEVKKEANNNNLSVEEFVEKFKIESKTPKASGLDKDPNGKLVFGDQRNFEQQVQDFQKQYDDALSGRGNYAFLSDKTPQERLYYAEKIVAKPLYKENVYQKGSDSFVVKPTEEFATLINSYLPKDFNLYTEPEQFEQALEDGRTQALRNDPILKQLESSFVKASKSSYDKWEAEKRNEWDLTTEEGVIKANKEANKWWQDNVSLPLENSDTFKSVFKEYTEITEALMAERNTDYLRSRQDTWFGGKLSDSYAYTEALEKGFKNFSLGFKKAGLTRFHGDIDNILKETAKLEKMNPDEETSWGTKYRITKAGTRTGYGTQTGTVRERLKQLEQERIKTAQNLVETVGEIDETEQTLSLFRNPDYADGISLEDAMLAVGDATTSIAVMGGTALAGTVTGGLGLAAMFGTTYGQNYYDAITKGLEADGISPTKEAIASAIADGKYADLAENAAFSALEIGLERAGAVPLMKSLTKSIGLGQLNKKSMASLFKGQIGQFAKNAPRKLKDVGIAGGREFATEGTQQVVSQVNVGTQLSDDFSDISSWSYFNPEEIKDAAISGGIVGVITLGGGKIAGQAGIEARALARTAATRFNMRDAESLKITDAFFNQAESNLKSDLESNKIDQAEYTKQSQALSNARNTGLKIPANYAVENKERSFDLIMKRNALQEEVDMLDPGLTEGQKQEISNINEELVGIAKEEYGKTIMSGAQNIAKDLGVPMEYFKDDKSISKKLNELEEQGYNVGEKKTTSFGTIVTNENGDQFILINESRDQNNVTTEAHEVLHAILAKTIGTDAELAKSIGVSLLNEIKNNSDKLNISENFLQRLTSYDLENNPQNFEEALTILSEEMLEGRMVYNETVFDKIGKYISDIYKKITGKPIKFKTGKDVFNFVRDYNTSIKKGKLTSAQQKAAVDGIETKDLNANFTDQGVRTPKESFSNDIDSFVIDKGLKSNDDFKNNSEAAFGVYNYIDTNSQFNNYIDQLINRDKNLGSLSPEIKQNINRKIKEEVNRRILTNYNPNFNDSFQSLFSFVYGNKEGKGGRAQSALLDVKKEYAKTPDTISNVTSEGVVMDFEDTSAGIDETIDAKDEVIESTFRRKVTPVGSKTKGISSDNASAIKELVQELQDELPSPSDPTYAKTVKKTYETKLKDTVKAGLGVTGIQTFEEFIDANPDVFTQKSEIPIQYFIEADKGNLIKNKERVFVKPNRKLTTQSEIRKYKDSGRVYVENEAQGVMLYDYLNPTPAQVKKFYNPTVKAGERSSLAGNRRGKFLEAAGYKMGRDATPEAQVKKGFSPRERGVTSEKLQVDQRVLFSDYENKQEQVGQAKSISGAAKIAGIESKITVNSSNRAAKQKEMLDSIVKYRIPSFMFLGGMFGNSGRKKQKGVYINVPARGGLYYGNTDPAFKEALKKARENDKYYKDVPKAMRVSDVKAFTPAGDKQSADNMDVLEFVAKKLESSVKKGMPIELASLFITSSYQATRGLIKIAAPFTAKSTNPEYALIGKSNQVGGKLPTREEHSPPASVIGGSLILAIKDGKVNNLFKDIRKNYIQVKLSKKDDVLLDLAKLDSTLPEGVSVLTPNAGILRMSAAGINLNTIIDVKSNKTFAEIMGVGVPKSFYKSPNMAEKQNEVIQERLKNPDYTESEAKADIKAYEKIAINVDKATVKDNKSQPVRLQFKSDKTNSSIIDELGKLDKAFDNARDPNAPNKGISVWDFDDTLATTKSNVLYTLPNGETKSINANEFAKKSADLEAEGAVFDFSEFSKINKGKKGPMFEKALARNKKFGNENVFILTARPMAAAKPIHDFLKALGLDIPLKNIVGLEDGDPGAKARWVVGKASEGYNDFYFADDAYKNVKAVQDALSVLDVKSKARQAFVKYSNPADLSKGFNDIIEKKTGIGSEKEYARIKAQVAGAGKGRFNFFIPPSAEDFVGLLYATLSKGKEGDEQMAWYKTHLLNPFGRAMQNISRDRISLLKDYKELKKDLKIVPKNLRKKIPGEPFTREQAVRVYIWTKQGMNIDGLSKIDLKELNSFVEENADLKLFADQLINMQKGDQYAAPRPGWPAGTITTDLLETLNTTKRSKYLEQWQQNADAIFSETNLNKLEAAYGKGYRNALENILSRMKSGRNRAFKGDALTGKVVDWLTGSIGTIMFFNTRSAILQTISAVNFINFSDNNIFRAGAAFANQKQFWSDFKYLFNSDFLKERRGGLRINVNEADIADMAKKGGVQGVINKLLEFGFTPTQLADSFAIASGGSTFYRNRVKALVKGGMEQSAAEKQAFIDFREISEESQQSSRPDRISAQQAGPLGRVVLAFANTPAQYARLIKKAASDLKNGRGDAKTNISKIIYYGVAQNLIFNALQQAIFALAFDEDEDDQLGTKTFTIANGMADSILRGIGLAGAVTSVVKNSIIRINNELEKSSPKLEKVGYELTKISPPISSKLSRVNQAMRSYQWDKDEMINGGWSLDNPAWLAGANVVSAATNIPLDRLIRKTDNVTTAVSQDLETWQRLALIGGWQSWEIGVEEKPKKNKKRKTTSQKTNRRKTNR